MVIKLVRTPPLIDASNYAMRSLGLITLFSGIGELLLRVLFLVVFSLPLDCILRTTFLDRNFKTMLPRKRKFFFHHVPSVALTGLDLRGKTS